MALTAVFQAFPTFTAAALLVKLSGLSSMTSHAESVVTFILLAVLFQSITVTSLGSRFPRFFKPAYEPLSTTRRSRWAKRLPARASARGVTATADDDDDVVGVGCGGYDRGIGGRDVSRSFFGFTFQTAHCHRARSVYPIFLRGEMDCFAALAMTLKNTCIRLAANAPSLRRSCPSKWRCAGKPGTRCTRGLAGMLRKQKRTQA